MERRRLNFWNPSIDKGYMVLRPSSYQSILSLIDSEGTLASVRVAITEDMNVDDG